MPLFHTPQSNKFLARHTTTHMKTILQFEPIPMHNKLFWRPCNSAAKDLLQKHRKAFDNNDLTQFLCADYEIQIDLGFYLGESNFVKCESIPEQK